MTSNIMQFADKQPEATATAQLFEDWFDPIEAAVRAQVHEFIQGMIEAELDEALSRTRYVRRAKFRAASAIETTGGEDGSAKPPSRGHRHGHRSRSLMGTFGEVILGG